LILMTRFEFQSRASLWQTAAPSKYIPPAKFGSTGLPRQRFDGLFRCLRFSHQVDVRPPNMPSEDWRWSKVGDFVKAFNEHRASNFIPSHRICVDESISRWYGMGGHWINEGLPCYMAIDRKPENGCEIQNACCGVSGVMIQLKLVKNVQEEEGHHDNAIDENAGLIHGCIVVKELVKPWFYTRRVICGDSYFASKSTALELLRLGLGFIGVVKTATRGYPVEYLHGVVAQERGQWKGVVHKIDGHDTLYAFMWVDRDRRYFITNTSSLRPGIPWVRQRRRQIAPVESQEPPERVELTVSQPKAAEVYYDVCGKIDLHNRRRHDTLNVEKKIQVKEWSMRVNLSIFAMIVVDTYLVYSQLKDSCESEKDFYAYLAEELIDNSHDGVARRPRVVPGGMVGSPELMGRDGLPRSGGYDVHITPTKRRRRNKSTQLHQGKCCKCSRKVTDVCSKCRYEHDHEAWICHTKTGRDCFLGHVQDKHSS
jgi:hypothetical protein